MADADDSYSASQSGSGRSTDDDVAFVVVDDECRCLDASDEACRILVAMRDEIVGAGFGELLTEEASECFAHVWRAFRKVGGHAGPFRVDAAKPLEVDIHVSADILPSRHLVLLSPAARHMASTASSMTGTVRANGARASVGRGRPHGDQSSPTAREREVLRMLAAGATDPQIAKRLSLSPATVRTHVRNAKAKLGAGTRAQAVALALARRIIE